MKLTGKCALLLLLVLFVVSTKFYPFFPNLINTHDEWVLHSHKLSNRNEFELEVNKTLINVSLDWLVSSFCVCVLRCTYQWHTHTACLNELLESIRFTTFISCWSLWCSMRVKHENVLRTCVHNFSLHIFIYVVKNTYKHFQFSSFAPLKIHANQFLFRYFMVGVDQQSKR